MDFESIYLYIIPMFRYACICCSGLYYLSYGIVVNLAVKSWKELPARRRANQRQVNQMQFGVAERRRREPAAGLYAYTSRLCRFICLRVELNCEDGVGWNIST